mgnify:FL=1
MSGRCIAIRHVAFEDAGVLADVLAARGWSLDYCEAGVEAIDARRIEAADLLVILGGPIGVYETREYPFLVDEIDALRARLAADRPTLGVCLGAQMIAAALGARVAPGPAKEIGYAPVALTQEGARSALAPLSGEQVLHWHGDNLDLPEGCARLAFTEACPVQAFSSGPRILGLQFHIEARATRIEQWLIGHAVELGRASIDPVFLRKQACEIGPATEAIGRRVLEAWLDGAVA